MSKWRGRLALFAAAWLIAGCAGIGNKFDPQAVESLQPGISTTADAVSLLGPASAESTGPNGARLLQWQYAQGSIFGGSGAHVAVLFDAQGRMVRVTHRHQTKSY